MDVSGEARTNGNDRGWPDLCRLLFAGCALLCLAGVGPVQAAPMVTVVGIVHDPQHRPVPGATAVLTAARSEWQQTAVSDSAGRFEIPAVPPGDYRISVTLSGFTPVSESLVIVSGAQPVLHFALALASVSQSVTVRAGAASAETATPTPTTLVNRDDVQQTPGADRTNGLQAITAFVPGSYMVHDQLHVRGGHQVSWLIDGIAVPNTDIGSTVGPVIDPKDMDYLEAQRGSYGAAVGDRTYGVFNVVPRTGFERNDDVEVVASVGTYRQTNDQVSVGGHSSRFAYYGSVSGNSSQLGLEPADPVILHDAQNGLSGFTTLIFNPSAANQLRLVASMRRDAYEVPNTPEAQAAGIADSEHERDAFVNMSWLHTTKAGLLTIAPFVHWNRSAYDGGATDVPFSTSVVRASAYGGGQASFQKSGAWNHLEVGVYGFRQNDSQSFAVGSADPVQPSFSVVSQPSGGEIAVFAEDRITIGSRATVSAGLRQTHVAGALPENATSPRVGATLAVGRATIRGFVGSFYQPPPLATVAGPLLAFVSAANVGFLPLRGERDREAQLGVTIPVHAWTIDADQFVTNATNYFDHNPVGNSNVFLPLTIERAYLRGTEITLRSPVAWRRLHVHAAYSYQHADGEGAVTGGLTDFEVPEGRFPLDHDQRHTFSAGGSVLLPRQFRASVTIYHGSGVPNGDLGGYLSPHTTADLAIAKQVLRRLSVSLNVLNATNARPLLDNSPTFGGTHYQLPREVYAQLRYSFHY